VLKFKLFACCPLNSSPILLFLTNLVLVLAISEYHKSRERKIERVSARGRVGTGYTFSLSAVDSK
jgi:hypothetical protein